MQHQTLLENYLRQLGLPTFAQNYQPFAQDAIRTNLSYERYLLALCFNSALILEFVGESYRFRQRMQLEEQAASSEAR